VNQYLSQKNNTLTSVLALIDTTKHAGDTHTHQQKKHGKQQNQQSP